MEDYKITLRFEHLRPFLAAFQDHQCYQPPYGCDGERGLLEYLRDYPEHYENLCNDLEIEPQPDLL